MKKLLLIGSLCSMLAGLIELYQEQLIEATISIIIGIILFIIRKKNIIPDKPKSHFIISNKRIALNMASLTVGIMLFFGYQYKSSGRLDLILISSCIASLLMGIGIQLYIIKKYKKNK